MPKVMFNDTEFDSFHEAVCAALFERYGWKWEKPRKALAGWFPDFLLKGDSTVYVECKGNVQWNEVQSLPLQKYEDAISGQPCEVLLIPQSPQKEKNTRGFVNSFLGYLYDGETWSYASLGRWSGSIGFCHNANSWKDRMSGRNIMGSIGDGHRPDVVRDWLSATHTVNGKRVSFFKRDIDSDVEEWDVSS